MTADRKAAVDAATALTGEDCIWSEGGQQGLTAQHPEQVMAGHLPGIWQDAGIANSGCEAVATVSSKITSAFFTRVRHILAPLIPVVDSRMIYAGSGCFTRRWQCKQ